ncbi:MAG TPA: tetratricopeptide repeat protein [Planctomycetes bacterium]|nr:tetratricopeptide repeat protein [Planctomycetota bacterium]
MSRKINWKLIIVLLIGLAVLGMAVYGLRWWNRLNRAEAGLELGNKAYENGLWNEAAKNLGRYLSVESEDIDALMKYAEAQLNIMPLKQNNIAQAINAYRRILRIEKTNTKAATRLIDIYIQMKLPSEAELIATQQLEHAGNNTIRRLLAKALVEQRKFARAADELKQVIKEAPSEVPAYDAMGRLVEMRPEDFSLTAEHWFNQAVQNNPDSAQARIIRGAFYLRNGDLEKALVDLEKAESFDLSDSLIQLSLAAEFIKAGAFEKALSHIQGVYQRQPDSAGLWHIWAMLAIKTGQTDMMKQVAGNGLKSLGHKSILFMPVAAELFVRARDFESGAGCITEMKQKQINPATVAFLEGVLAEKKGQWAKAVKHWTEAMRLGRNTEDMQLAMATAFVRLEDTQSAIQHLRTFLNQNQNSYRARLFLAKLFIENQDWAFAAEQARAAVQIKPDSIRGRSLYLQARMQLLAGEQMTDDTRMWENIETELDKLQQDTGGAPETKLLGVKLALIRRQTGRAKQLSDELAGEYPSNVKVALARVDVLLAQNEIDRAVTELENITENHRESVTAVKYLVSLLARQKKFPDCRRVITEAIERMTSAENRRRLQFMLTDIYIASGEPAKACEFLKTLADKSPDDITVKRRLLDCGRLTDDTDNLQKLVDEIKSIEGPDGRQWRYEQAKLWFASDAFNERYPEIILLLKENLLANPDDQSSRRLLATSYERAGEYQLALSAYRELINRIPEDIQLVISTVATMYKAGEYEQADSLLARAARQKLSDPRLSRLELYSCIRQGKLDSAGDILEELLSEKPDDDGTRFSLALLKMQQEKLNEARELLNQLLKKNPDSLSVTAQLVEINLRQEKDDQALELCDEMVGRLNNPSAYLLRARAYAGLKQMSRAKTDMEKAVQLEPDDIKTLVLKSRIHQAMGEIDQAISSIKRATEIAPQDYQVQRQAALTFLTSRDRQQQLQGRRFLDKALALNPDDTELKLYKARLLLSEATAPSVERAVSILAEITRSRPKVPQAWAMLVEIYLQQDDPAKAMDLALRGLSYLPRDKLLMLAKAQCETAISPVHSIPTLKALLEIYPDDIDAIIFLADTYVLTGRCSEAVELLESRLKSAKGRDSRKIKIALAEALYESGDTESAHEQFSMLYEEQPDDSAAVVAHIRVMQKAQRWDEVADEIIGWYKKHPKDTATWLPVTEALAVSPEGGAKKAAESILHSIIDIDPGCVDALSSLGVLLHMSGNYADAAQTYEKVLKLEPERLTALNNLAWILCKEQDQCRRALELVERGIEQNPEYIDLIDTRGTVYYRLGWYDKAVEDFTKCTKLYMRREPAAAGSYLRLGKTLEKLARYSEAIVNLKKSLDINSQVGGLSQKDADEARRLLTELSEKSNYVSVTN